MDSVPHKPARKITIEAAAEGYYQNTIQEQNKQIYTLYGRITDLVSERDSLAREVERLSELLKLK